MLWISLPFTRARSNPIHFCSASASDHFSTGSLLLCTVKTQVIRIIFYSDSKPDYLCIIFILFTFIVCLKTITAYVLTVSIHIVIRCRLDARVTRNTLIRYRVNGRLILDTLIHITFDPLLFKPGILEYKKYHRNIGIIFWNHQYQREIMTNPL